MKEQSFDEDARVLDVTKGGSVRDIGGAGGITPLHLEEYADEINSALTRGVFVAVHCFAGISRSPAAVAAYLIKYKGFTKVDAIEYISKYRPCVSLNMSVDLVLQDFAAMYCAEE